MHRYTQVTGIINYQSGLYKIHNVLQSKPLTSLKSTIMYFHSTCYCRVLLNYSLQNYNTVQDVKYNKTSNKILTDPQLSISEGTRNAP
jgi:hypothetical protein